MCGGGGTRRSTTSRTGTSSTGTSRDDTTQVEEPESVEIDSEDPCYFRQITDLSAINQDVLDDVNVGDVFPVELQDARPCVVDFDGQVIGSIFGQLADRLEGCIEKGYEYRAEILDSEDGDCEVEVLNRCPIDAETMLAGPDPEVLDRVSEGDEFDVVVRDDSLCVVDDSDRIVGPISAGWTGILISCIESGREYRAQIVEIDGGNCTVQVLNAPPPE